MARPKREVAPKRGQVYLVSFDPTVGSEIRKTRPALVLQNDIANRHSPITIVAAITSRVDEKLYPTEVLIPKSRHQPSKDQASSFPPATNGCVIAIWTLNGGRSPTLLSSPPERRPDLGRR